jgi:hypothetical protein
VLLGSFHAIGLNNGVTDKLESSSILIFSIQVKGNYTQKIMLLKQEIHEEEHKRGHYCWLIETGFN